MAEHVGMDRSFISDLENGRKEICIRNLELLATMFGMSISKLTWHALGHCHATFLDAVGAPLGTTQGLLGHASPGVTRQIYLHAISEEQR